MVWRRGSYQGRAAPARSASSTPQPPPAAPAAAAAPAEEKKPKAEKKKKESANKATAAGVALESRVSFISNMIKGDLASGKHKSVLTRFPPEPNGYFCVCVCVCMCVCVCVWVGGWVGGCICVCVYMYIFVHTYTYAVCVCVCVYMHILTKECVLLLQNVFSYCTICSLTIERVPMGTQSQFL